MIKPILGLVLLSVALVSAACQADQNPEGPRRPLQVGPVLFQVETVSTAADRQRGLMWRTKLTDQQGMLFVFETDQQLAFWMKNTLIPLSIAYIDANGQIRQIADMAPKSLATVVSDYAVRYALEVAQGAFSRRGVTVGDHVDIASFLAKP